MDHEKGSAVSQGSCAIALSVSLWMDKTDLVCGVAESGVKDAGGARVGHVSTAQAQRGAV